MLFLSDVQENPDRIPFQIIFEYMALHQWMTRSSVENKSNGVYARMWRPGFPESANLGK